MAGLVNDRKYGKRSTSHYLSSSSSSTSSSSSFLNLNLFICFSDTQHVPCTVPVNIDHEGYVESENALFKHVAIREREQESKYKPAVANIAPR